ncbi:hypothetical protein HMPREF9431_00879 [Segatella oulorum F0390]|uniref:Uncharacterized protein n=1 Tax=Segatella oulorum F0390 TaxID=702438 RepID=G1WAM8_9BACT|nr:hypothetical protein HMPREF9431_00879 [Segatella oulorum F0390]
MKMIPAESQIIPTESRKGVLKYVLLFLLTEETKSTHKRKDIIHILYNGVEPLAFTMQQYSDLSFLQLLSREQASKYFFITC